MDADSALAIAERNAKSAEDQVRSAEQIAKLQLRAYVGTPSIYLVDRFGDDPRFVIDIKNFGQTPASGVVAHAVLSISAEGAPRPNYAGLYDFGVLQPGRIQTFICGFAKENLITNENDLTSGAKLLHLYGLITYFDMYGRSYIKEFVAKVSHRRVNGREGMIDAAVHVLDEEEGEQVV